MNVPTSVHLQNEWNYIVQECVRLRNENKTTKTELANMLEIDRRKIISLEKGNFDVNTADCVLAYFGKQFCFKIYELT